jgi:hypothetical protein
MFQTEFVEIVETHVLCIIYFSSENRVFLRDDAKKYDTVRHATGENTTQKICDLHAG